MSQIIWTIRALLVRTKRVMTKRKLRLKARNAAAKPVPDAFFHYVVPRSIGQFEAGEELLNQTYTFAGQRVETLTESVWDVTVPSPAFADEIHSFAWLDDLAAVGTKEARYLAQRWTLQWIHEYGSGRYEGWTPGTTGRRLMRICSHARFIRRGLSKEEQSHLFVSLAKQTRFLRDAYNDDEHLLERVSALVGLIYAGVSFSGFEKTLNIGNKTLGEIAAKHIDTEGEIDSRNPEELMSLFAMLTWSFCTIEDADKKPDPRITNALDRIAPTLRNLRLGDGSLTRNHGGGRGVPGRLDQLLSDSRVRRSRAGKVAMGYERLTAGRVTLILDAARPPSLEVSSQAHAGTLAFEMSSGAIPIFVNCGPGRKFGSEWERVSRATGAHTTVTVGGVSSSTLAGDSIASRTFGQRLLTEPLHVTRQHFSETQGHRLIASHDGYAPMFGVIHERSLFISIDGKRLTGTETILPAKTRSSNQAEGFVARFHLHPEVDSALADDGKSVRLTLPNRETWLFTTSGDLEVDTSVYLDQWLAKPIATKQVVASSRIVEYGGQITWTMTRVADAERRVYAVRETTASINAE